jgi:hypothetical protein
MASVCKKVASPNGLWAANIAVFDGEYDAHEKINRELSEIIMEINDLRRLAGSTLTTARLMVQPQH